MGRDRPPAVPGAATAPTWPAGTATVATAPADADSLWAHIAARTPVVLLPPPDPAAASAAAAAAAATHLSALTPAAAAAAAGDVAVAVETRAGKGSSFGQGTTTTLPFRTALRRLAEDPTLYLSAQAPPQPGPGNLPLPAGDLALALAAPSPAAPAGLIPIRHPLAGGLVLAALNLWVGGAAAASGLHADVHDNLLGVVAGAKTVTLFPPRCVGELATVGRPVRVWPNGRLVFAGAGEGAAADGACEAGLREAAARAAQRAAVAAVVAGGGGGTDDEEEAALEAALEAGGPAGLDDYSEDEGDDSGKPRSSSSPSSHAQAQAPPTFSRADLSDPASVRATFPAFPWHAGRTVTLTPGATLYIPAGWFHYVASAPEESQGAGGGPSPPAPPRPWAGLHCAVNHWFHPPDAAHTGGHAAPYSRPYWGGVWAEAVAACPRLRAAVEAQDQQAQRRRRDGAGWAAPPQTPTPAAQPGGRARGGEAPPPPAPPRPPPAAAASVDAALALMRAGLNGLASFDAGGRAALRAHRRGVVLRALAGRRTRHGAGCVLPWVNKRRRA